MQESRSRRGDCWAGREVILATETGQPCRAAAQRGGTGMGSGVTLPRVRILTPRLHRLVTWGETTHLPELLVPRIQEGGDYSIPGWVTGNHQRKSPGLYEHLPNGGPQGAQAGISSRAGAQAWAGLPDVAKKWCQEPRPLTRQPHLALRSAAAALIVAARPAGDQQLFPVP